MSAANRQAHPPGVNAILIGLRGRAVISAATALGIVAFGWPFFAAPGRIDQSLLPPLLFGALLLMVVAVVVAELAAGGIDAKAIAMLGVLSALGAALRPLGAGTAGIETVFFTLIAAGRVFGPGFGFVLGSTTIMASALVTGGVGPWMPYQMFGAAWVGMGAGCLPRVRRRSERYLLAAYGLVSAYAYGLAVNLSFWPFYAGSGSTLAYVPGAALSTNLVHYLFFDATTSLGWDTGRALTNAVCLLLLGPPLVAIFRRAARRAAFDAPVSFEAALRPSVVSGPEDQRSVPHRAVAPGRPTPDDPDTGLPRGFDTHTL